MTLEGDDDPALSGHLACGAQRHLDLGRVMRVVVVDPDVADLTLEVEGAGLVADLAQPLLVGERQIAVVVPLARVLLNSAF